MANPFDKINPGDPWPRSATFHDEVLDMLRWWRGERGDGRALKQLFRQAGVVLIRNESGTDRDLGEILGIDEPLITPTEHLNEFKRRVVLSCITPDASEHLSRFVVLLEPIPSGKIGWAVVDGVTVCWHRPDASGGSADVLDGALPVFVKMVNESVGHLSSSKPAAHPLAACRSEQM